MRVIGIDPGISGALVVLEDGVPVEWLRTPIWWQGKHNRVDPYALGDWLKAVTWNTALDGAVIEQVGAMPNQGVTSMFSFGHATGTIYGALGALSIPVRRVTPQAWKKAAGIAVGANKDAARSKATEIWPKWYALRKKGEGQAFADAALIAKFG